MVVCAVVTEQEEASKGPAARLDRAELLYCAETEEEVGPKLVPTSVTLSLPSVSSLEEDAIEMEEMEGDV
jgi:hypothetical protein